MKLKISKLRLFEFFLIGIAMGIVEDIIAIWLATDAHINLRVILIAGLVALPFAFISEVVVDIKGFPKFVRKILKAEEEIIEKVEKEI